LKLVQVNHDQLKRVPASADPVAIFLHLVNKLHFLISLPPTLKKDARLITVENFYRHNLFSGKMTQGGEIKNEMLKFNNGSREVVKGSKEVR